MKMIAHESNSALDTCAGLIIETIPKVMAAMRRRLRYLAPSLSVPQFRSLAYLEQHPGASVCDVAEQIGLSVSTISKLLDALVKRHLIMRETAPEDRRRATLHITAQGIAVVDAVRNAAQQHMIEILAQLPADEIVHLAQALQNLQRLLPSLSDIPAIIIEE